MTQAATLHRFTRLFTPCAVIAAALTVLAPGEAAAQDGQGPIVVTATPDIQLGEPEHLGPDRYRHSTAVDLGMFVDVLDLEALELRFDDPGIELLDGAGLDSSIFRTLVTGGVSLNVGGRLWQVLRFPEVRLTLGGASFEDRPYVPVGPAGSGLSARPTSLFFCRIELGAGLQYRIGPVAPFVMVRGAYAIYSFDVDVRHEDLGSLGTESAAGGAWELATDVGVSVEVTPNLELGLSWRHTWIGATGDGAMLTLTANTN